jgi:glycosyltransferase involved in cell wall biosynthesis
VVVPNGVDTRRFRPPSGEERAAARRELGLPDRPTVLYQGAHMPANRTGLEWVRRLAGADGRFTFLVAGSVTPPERSDGFVAAGSVPDMRPYLSAADFAVCPIAHGGGTKLKLLECMAAGLPTVAFEEAIRGTSVRPGEHALVAPHDERRLLEALGTLADDPELAARIRADARDLAERRYDWTDIGRGLEDALTGLTRGNRRPPATSPPTAAPPGARAAR